MSVHRLPADRHLSAGELMDEFCARLTNPRSYAVYRREGNRLTRWLAEQDLHPLVIRRQEWDSYVRWLHSLGLAPASIAKAAKVAHAFYSWCEDVGYLQRSPCRGARLPKQPSTSPYGSLDRAQAMRLLDAAEDSGPEDHVIICLLLGQGRRVSEACAARVEHLYTSGRHRVLRVRQKGGDFAVMALAPPTVAAIDAHLAGRDDPDAGPLLEGRRPGTHMTPPTVRAAVRRLATAAEIRGRVVPHMLRRSFVTLSLDAGVQTRDVQDAAGHASADTTRHYDAGRRSLDRHAAYALAHYLGGGGQLAMFDDE